MEHPITAKQGVLSERVQLSEDRLLQTVQQSISKCPTNHNRILLCDVESIAPPKSTFTPPVNIFTWLRCRVGADSPSVESPFDHKRNVLTRRRSAQIFGNPYGRKFSKAREKLHTEVTPLFWVVLHVKALELDKLVKSKFAEGLPFTRVLPPCPS